MEGWIRLNRSIMDNWVWKDRPFSEGQAWVDLLLLANHEDVKTLYKGEIIVCERGTVNRSILSLSERWKWSRKKTKGFITRLENDEMVTTNITTNRTTITIVNYGVYQGEGTTKGTTKGASRVSTKVQRVPTNKNEKKDNNILPKGNIKYFDSDVVDEAFKSFIEYRNTSFKPKMSAKAITLSVNTLNKLSNGNDAKAVAIINQSIERGWKGLFDIKEEPTKKNNSFNTMIHTDYDFDELEKMLNETK